jgi:hypothetical protein
LSRSCFHAQAAVSAAQPSAPYQGAIFGIVELDGFRVEFRRGPGGRNEIKRTSDSGHWCTASPTARSSRNGPTTALNRCKIVQLSGWSKREPLMPYALYSERIRVSELFVTEDDLWVHVQQNGLYTEVIFDEDLPPQKILDERYEIHLCAPDGKSLEISQTLRRP